MTDKVYTVTESDSAYENFTLYVGTDKGLAIDAYDDHDPAEHGDTVYLKEWEGGKFTILKSKTAHLEVKENDHTV